MVDNLPVYVDDVPFLGIGGRAEYSSVPDVAYNEHEMVTGSVVLQVKHALFAPVALHVQEMTPTPGFPQGQYLYGYAPRVQQSLRYTGQDSRAGEPFSWLSMISGDLSAPALNTGNSNFSGRC